MAGGTVYLDHNATSPARPAVGRAMAAALAEGGNPSSVHGRGRGARRRLEAVRRALRTAVSAPPEASLTFTSGATEANNLAMAQAEGPVLVSAIEHASVLEAAVAERLPVCGDGRLDLEALDAALAGRPPALVSVMVANNETGIVQPVAEAAAVVHRHGGLLHCDAVQALGRTDLDMTAMGADLLSLSAHKAGGPPGVGALIARPGLEIRASLKGGGQEGRRRAGTENLPAIAGLGALLDVPFAEERARLAALRDRFEAEIRARLPGATIIGGESPRLVNTSCLALPGMPAERLVMALDLSGIAVSSGAACSSGRVGRSHVLEAMRLPEDVLDGAIRVSLGWSTTAADLDRLLAALLALETRWSRRRQGAALPA